MINKILAAERESRPSRRLENVDSIPCIPMLGGSLAYSSYSHLEATSSVPGRKPPESSFRYTRSTVEAIVHRNAMALNKLQSSKKIHTVFGPDRLCGKERRSGTST